jgi:hypothetical protein
MVPSHGGARPRIAAPLRTLALLAALGAGAPGCSDGGVPGGPTPPPGSPPPGQEPPPGGPPPGEPPRPGFALLAEETFDRDLPDPALAHDPVPDDGPFSDGGAYFTARGVRPPAAFRASVPFSSEGWLTAEAYSRRAGARLSDLAAVVPDPAGGSNRVLRVRTPEHTDGLVVRPSAPLPPRYRVSLRVGHAAYGDGKPGQNGYGGGETAGPWWPSEDATRQNGFYWLAILDALPRPHVNTWIHHHRKVVVDSDNHHPPWMEVWDGRAFVPSGEHPVMMFALDGRSAGSERSGNPFLSFSNGAWQPTGRIRAVDAYLPATWYRATIERDGPRYAIELSGRFRHGGERTYRASLDARAACVWHYPVTPEEAAGAGGCAGVRGFASTPGFPAWPPGGAWPEWFLFGDPHVNYYEGEVLYDDVRLEVWRD